jgi:uncharacterized protein
MTPPAGAVAELWRYPVKSMGGEICAALAVEPRGVIGDRRWAVVDADGKLGSGKNTRRFRRIDGLLDCTARLDGDVPVMRFPDGHEVSAQNDAGDEALRSFLRRRDVSLSIETAVAHHDAAPLHLITDASISAVRRRVDDAAVDVRRFRPNIVVDTGLPPGFPEDAWIGRRIQIGEVVVEVTEGTERCVMTNAAQPGLERSHQVLTEIASANDLDLGVYATVVRPGLIRRGDPLSVE